jgi:hypothetical protein
MSSNRSMDGTHRDSHINRGRCMKAQVVSVLLNEDGKVLELQTEKKTEGDGRQGRDGALI